MRGPTTAHRVRDERSCVSVRNVSGEWPDAAVSVYYTGSYRTNYTTFIQAVMNRYGANGNVGYIRFGLARGGEVFPPAWRR